MYLQEEHNKEGDDQEPANNGDKKEKAPPAPRAGTNIC